MYRLINQSCDLVFAELDRRDYVGRYLRLTLACKTGNVRGDKTFQREFRQYWAMGVARMKDPFRAAFYQKFFDLLSERLRTRKSSVPDVVRELVIGGHDKGETLWFSFASKLVHMVDPRLPVFDNLIAEFFHFAGTGGDFEDRLSSLMDFYEFLRQEYVRVIRQKLLGPSLRAFRDRYADASTVPDERIIDWLAVGCVAVLRKGAQRRGDMLYE